MTSGVLKRYSTRCRSKYYIIILHVPVRNTRVCKLSCISSHMLQLYISYIRITTEQVIELP